MNRYTMTAHITGPYCTGAAACFGAAPVVRVPQAQRRVITWCSVTCTLIGGMSNTCRREQSTCSAPDTSEPQPRQLVGSWRITTSGSATCSKVAPGWPGCPPGLRLLLPRKDRGVGFAGPSLDGGFDEFRELART